MTILSEVPLEANSSKQLIIIIVLIFINAFFAASELAILSASPIKIGQLAKNKNKKALLVQKLQADDTKLLSTIQIGITLAGFFSSATAAVSLSTGFEKILLNMNVPYADKIALVVVTLVLSYFTLVLGELFPKRIALRSPEKIAMLVARPIAFIKIIFKPIVWLLSGSCNLLVAIFRLKKNSEEKVTEDEVKALIGAAVEDGTILTNEAKMINSVFMFGDLLVRDIMHSRADTFMINIDDSITTIKRQIKEQQYSRIPVYKENRDNVIGILNIKDILLSLPANYTNEDIKKILRRPYFVVESIKAEKLFSELKENKNQIAIVINSEGSVSGLVTMEDLIEEVMGNIYDEYDEKDESIISLENNMYLVDASLPIQDVNKALDLKIKMNSEQYNTLAGYIFYHAKYLPQVNDEIEIKESSIFVKIKEVVSNRITKVELTILEKVEEEE